VDWQARLRREGLFRRFGDFDLVYHASLQPPVPPEYHVPGLVGLTFRFAERPQGGHVYVTVLDLPAVLRLGARIGLDEAESVAMVDSHERMHVALQLAGVPEEKEEEQLHIVDATWLSLRHPRAAHALEAGEFGLVTRVREDFWEMLIDTEAPP
jgi:hypothetical protein